MCRPSCLLTALAMVPLLTGCGRPALAPVKGRVTCRGKPVAEAAVLFSPMPKSEGGTKSGKAAGGGTDADGRFVLTTYDRGDGALIGKHRVSVTVDDTVSLECRKKVVVVEVHPGNNDLNIELND
jgi:hypothetical protein